MIVLTCECGEIFRADEKHIGYSIRCSNCQRIIPVARKSDASRLASSRQEPSIDIIPPEPIHSGLPRNPLKPEHSFLGRKRLIPLIGLLALAVGVTFTVVSLRARKGDPAASQSSSSEDPTRPSSAAVVSVADNSPTPIILTKLQSATPDSSKGIPLQQSSPNPLTFVPLNQSEPPITAPTAPPETVRYATGTNLVRPRSLNGRGTLKISNGTSLDAIAKLVDSETNKTVRKIYIQAYSDTEIGTIGIGDYILKFALGTGYDKDSERFLYSQSFSKFDEPFEFREYETYEGVRWRNFEVSLNAVVGGNAQTSRISAADFEDH